MSRLVGVLLICIALSASACSTNTPEEAPLTKGISLVRPDSIRGYVVWKNPRPEEISTWQIQFSRQIPDPDAELISPNRSHNSASPIELRSELLTTLDIEGRTYVRVPQQYRRDPTVFVTVTGNTDSGRPLLTSQDLVVSPDGDRPPICPGCVIPTLTSTWTCNGIDYAWRIDKLERPNGAYYMRLSGALAYFDPVLQVGVPYYLYTDAQFAGQYLGPTLSDNPYTIIYGVPHQYVNAAGTLLPGPNVLAIEKRLEQFEGEEQHTGWFVSNPNWNDVDTPLAFVMATFDDHAPATGRDPLMCTPYPDPPSLGSSYSSGWAEALIAAYHERINKGIFWPEDLGGTDGRTPLGGLIDSLPRAGERLRLASGARLVEAPSYQAFTFERLDQDMEPTVIQASEIEFGESGVAAPDVDLPTGLYRLHIQLENGINVPYVFEVL